ncbi:MAG: hypothetical protein CVU54_07790 [Deltaproteobacteria bacterium HGW-Deltaproteobacteria-12]|nr:MAG: hypothetical protein CVU54_07790 [Deltaproteobacteria bacterium HGW-Deltaproteobacteria-12]
MPQKINMQASETDAQTAGHNSLKKNFIWQADNRKIWLALALLITGFILTCTAALYVKRDVESNARKGFDFACSEIKNRILSRMQQHAQILRSGSAFFEINEDITREQWHNSIARQNIEQVLPGIQGIGYAKIIPHDQLALHERKIRNEGFPQYAVKPTGKREIYTSIIYLEPFSDRNLRAFGYDMFSEPIRRKAMEHARDFDKSTLSGKIMLVQETDKDIQAGTLMYVPVYKRGLPVKTIEERRRAIRGWVYSPYRMNDLMRGILGAWELGEGRQIRLEVFDGKSFQPEALLYDSGPIQKHEPAPVRLFSEQSSIPFKNHLWSLRFTQAVHRNSSIDYSKAWHVLISGTLASVLIFILYLMLINANHKSQKLADALTREIRESTERKRVEETLSHANRALAVISQISQTVVRTSEQNILFAEACRIAVETGNFRMAWIGLIDEQDKFFKPVAWHGAEEGYLTIIKNIFADDIADGRSPTGRAIRDGKYSYCNDIANDPVTAPWREEALQRGYRSSIALPLILQNKVIGAFTIYDADPFIFTEREINLLTEVTGDINYALEKMDIEKKHRQGEDKIKRLNENLERRVAARTAELAVQTAELERIEGPDCGAGERTKDNY